MRKNTDYDDGRYALGLHAMSTISWSHGGQRPFGTRIFVVEEVSKLKTNNGNI
jgi:hypothetical protein